MMETQQQSKQKFITLMQNLIQHINENPAHQLTIYECLNTQQIKRLFESLHDYSKVLRLTALFFICKLLYNSPPIVDTLLTRDNCDLTMKKNSPSGTVVPMQKYIITGLQNYKIQPFILAQILTLINNKIKPKLNTLFWYIQIQTKNIGYFSADDVFENMSIDPNTHIVGIFVGEPQLTKQSSRTIINNQSNSLIRKNFPQYGKGKYVISKAGQFSINRKN